MNPANGTVTYTLKLKTNANIDASKVYKLSSGVKINLTSLMSDGTTGDFYSSGSSSTMDIPGNLVYKAEQGTGLDLSPVLRFYLLILPRLFNLLIF